MVAITGAPATSAQRDSKLLHHTLGDGDFRVFAAMFAKVTAAQAFLTGEGAPAEIDRVLVACLRHKRPVYICLPTDVANLPADPPRFALDTTPLASDPAALAEAVDAAAAALEAAQRPAVLADLGVHRHGVQAAVGALLDRTQYPFATLTMGKGVLPESRPQFIGVYDGRLSSPYVRDRIEKADCCLALASS